MQIIILQFCRLEISQESHWADTKIVAGLLCSSLETAVKNTFPCIFQLLDTTCLPWLQHPSLSKYITPISSSRVTSVLSQTLTVSFLKDLCDYTEVTQDNPDNLSLSRSLTWSHESSLAKLYS